MYHQFHKLAHPLMPPLPAGAVLDKAISLLVFAEKTPMTVITAMEVVLNCVL